MNSISKLSCTLLATLPMVVGCQAIVTQEQEKVSPPFTSGNDNPIKVFIAAERDNNITVDSPPSLDSVAIRVSEDDALVDKLPMLATFVNEYLLTIINLKDGTFDPLNPLVNREGSLKSTEDVIEFGRQLVMGLANISNTIVPTDLEAKLVNPSEAELVNPSYAGFAAFSLNSLLNDVKCRALQVLALAAREDFAGISEELVSEGQGYCEIPGLGKITTWNFNADKNGRYGQFSLQDMKVDRYMVGYDADTATVTYTLVDQLSYDWEISVKAYDVSKLHSQDEYEDLIMVNADADPFVPHPDYLPNILDGSVSYPSLPKKAKDTTTSEGNTIWERNLELRIFSHGEVIVPTKVTKTKFEIVYKDQNPDPSKLEFDNSNTSGQSPKPKVFDDVHGKKFHRLKAAPGSSVELPESDPYRQVSELACIDLMIDAKEVPKTFADFPDQRGFCLGRCAQPLIANSK